MPPQYAPQQTLQYSLFIKRALKESLLAAFANHPSPTVQKAKVELDFQMDRWILPAVLIKFYERKLPNAGVGHVEYLPSPTDPNPNNPTEFIKYYHRMYSGDVSFEVYGQTSVDRDLVRDAFIETIGMNDATLSGSNFLARFYNDMTQTPYGLWHFPALMWDDITGYGEQTMLAPWRPEDGLVYQVTYRVPIFGEFYSNTPTLPSSNKLLAEVDLYPWVEGLDPPPDQHPISQYPNDWYRFTGWPSNEVYI